MVKYDWAAKNSFVNMISSLQPIRSKDPLKRWIVKLNDKYPNLKLSTSQLF
jgi:hypothetical protein